MLEKVEDDEHPAGAQDAVGGVDGALRAFSVVQRLAEDGEVDAAFFNGWILDVTDAEFQVGQPVGHGQLLGVIDHFWREIDGDDLLRPLGEELGKRALSSAQIRDVAVIERFDERLGEGFPRASGNVVLAESSREFVEVGSGVILALSQDVAEREVVPRDLGNLARRLERDR